MRWCPLQRHGEHCKHVSPLRAALSRTLKSGGQCFVHKTLPLGLEFFARGWCTLDQAAHLHSSAQSIAELAGLVCTWGSGHEHAWLGTLLCLAYQTSGLASSGSKLTIFDMTDTFISQPYMKKCSASCDTQPHDVGCTAGLGQVPAMQTPSFVVQSKPVSRMRLGEQLTCIVGTQQRLFAVHSVVVPSLQLCDDTCTFFPKSKFMLSSHLMWLVVTAIPQTRSPCTALLAF